MAFKLIKQIGVLTTTTMGDAAAHATTLKDAGTSTDSEVAITAAQGTAAGTITVVA
tara:strand:- start:198 stop:365 length:168 start_codon:yes stop_codon:yes gene_type:complete